MIGCPDRWDGERKDCGASYHAWAPSCKQAGLVSSPRRDAPVTRRVSEGRTCRKVRHTTVFRPRLNTSPLLPLTPGRLSPKRGEGGLKTVVSPLAPLRGRAVLKSFEVESLAQKK